MATSEHFNPPPESNDMEHLFRDLAAAALRLSGQMLEDLPPDARASTDMALRGGARAVLEFGPLPAFEYARLVLVEREGTRHTLSSVNVKSGTTH